MKVVHDEDDRMIFGDCLQCLMESFGKPQASSFTLAFFWCWNRWKPPAHTLKVSR
jgi:hypothetical protein